MENQGLEVASSSALLCFDVMEKQWKSKDYYEHYRDYERFVDDEVAVELIFHLRESS